MTSTFKYPAISNEGGLSVYLDQIKKFPMLDAEEEYMLAKNCLSSLRIRLFKSSLIFLNFLNFFLYFLSPKILLPL